MVAKTTHPKLRIARDKVAVAWQGATGVVDGVPYAVQRGTRLKGAHPFVRYMGSAAFVEDGTPESEWPTYLDAAVALGEARGVEEAQLRAEAAAKRPTIPANTPISALVQCVQGITASKAGTCAEGTVLFATDPLVRIAPAAFRPLVETLVVG